MIKKLAFLLLLMLFSCKNKEEAFSETFKDFPENRWKINDVKTFAPVLNKDVKDAGIYLYFSHVFEPGYDNIPVAVQWQAPDGKEEIELVELKFKDENGNALNDCAGDVCEIKVPVKEHLTLLKGSYKVAILPKFNGDYLPNVLAVGLRIEKAE
jgi:gliding motility-associated lipoprotein GldH